jgi:hypothetical protein
MHSLTKIQTLTRVVGLGLVIYIMWIAWNRYYSEPFTTQDKAFGDQALEELDGAMARGDDIPDITDDDLAKNVDRISIIKESIEGDSPIEHFRGFGSGQNYWRRHYYANNYQTGMGGWPPGLYNRMYNWSPNFYTGSGWQHYLRPGYNYLTYPRQRWYKKTNAGKHAYYYMNNDSR